MLAASLVARPVFVMTSDQDWAPSWAMEHFTRLVAARGVPLHLFRTNPCPVADGLAGRGAITQGWHPNFLPGSSQGSTPSEVVTYCQTHFPKARTVRSHAFREDTFLWRALAGAGIVADSQIPTRFQSHLSPLQHCSGIWRFPVFFEDDVFLATNGALALDGVDLFSPGLKILNFHAIHVANNTPSMEFYETHKQSPMRHEGRGIESILVELFDRITAAGHAFVPFESLVDTFIGC